MRYPRWTNRRGATVVETALVLPIFLILVLGMVDLALAVFRQHVISQAARQATRLAIVHGQLAPPEQAQWGPGTIEALATATGVPIVNGLLGPGLVPPREAPGFLTGLHLEETTIRLEWLDGNSQPERRVQATIATTYRPIFLSLFVGDAAWTLRAASTMRIAH